MGKIKHIFLIIVCSICISGNISTKKENKIIILKYQYDLNLRQENYTLAYRQLKKLLYLVPDDPEVLFTYSKVCIRLNKYDEAIKTLSLRSNSIKGEENRVKLLAWLGSLYAYTGKYKPSLDAYYSGLMNCLRTDIENPELIANLFNNIACLYVYTSPIEKSHNEKPHITLSKRKLKQVATYFGIACHYNEHDSVIIKNRDYFYQFDTLDIDLFNHNDRLILAHQNYQNKNVICSKKDKIKKRQEAPYILKYLTELIEKLNRYDQLIFVLDYSGSMTSGYNIIRNGDIEFWSRDILLKNTMDYTLNELDKSSKVGAISVNGECVFNPRIKFDILENVDRSFLNSIIKNTMPEGATPLNLIFEESINLFDFEKNDKKAIILLSDGLDTCGDSINICDISDEFNALNVDIYVLSYLIEDESSISQYAVYNCIANKELMGLKSDLSIEDKNVEINLNIYPFSLIKKIEKNNCLPSIDRYSMFVKDIYIPTVEKDTSELFAQF